MEGAPGLHHGGYMEGYGQIAGHQFRVNRDLCNHDPRGCDPAMIVQAKRVSDAFGRFRRVASCRDAVDRVASGRHFKRLPPTLALVPLESLVLVIT